MSRATIAAERLDSFPRRRFAFLPTPFVELPRLSELLGGPRILVKRDDQTGLALGGNKTRKLEFLVGEALAQGCDSLITGGAAQSNHCRQTAAAAAAAGLECHLALGGEEPPLPEGNLLLDRLLGAKIHWGGPRRKGEDIPAIADELRRAGRKPFVIPYGGSNATGALGYVDAMRELASQTKESGLAPDAIVFASSSGGTHAGMEVGAALFGISARLVGIAIDKFEGEGPGLAERIEGIARGLSSLFDTVAPGAPLLREDFLGGGYGVVGAAEREAVALAARTEGILLDPVYSGRAFAGMLAMIRAGEFRKEETLLFWHTGGAPALFPYAGDLLR